MEAYYSNQAAQSMPHFSGNYRQRGSGFGALAAGIGRVSLPLARKFLWPAAKKIGRDLLVQGAAELVEVATKKKSAKQASKNTVAKTARKQGGSLQSRIATGRNIIRRNTTTQDNSLKQKTKNLNQKNHFLKTPSEKESSGFFLASEKGELIL